MVLIKEVMRSLLIPEKTWKYSWKYSGKYIWLQTHYTDLKLRFASFEHFSVSTSQGRIFPLVFTVLQLLYGPNVGKILLRNTGHAINTSSILSLCVCVCTCLIHGWLATCGCSACSSAGWTNGGCAAWRRNTQWGTWVPRTCWGLHLSMWTNNIRYFQKHSMNQSKIYLQTWGHEMIRLKKSGNQMTSEKHVHYLTWKIALLHAFNRPLKMAAGHAIM